MLDVDVSCTLGAFELAAKFQSTGRLTSLFGRSGSGKSTLVNIIAGLIEPDSGRVRAGDVLLFDRDSGTNLPARKRRVGYVFQEGALLPHLSVRHNLRFGSFFTRRDERYIEFDQIVDLLDLGRLLERRPGLLSGGEKKRVAIGRALLASPRLLLMDEPLAQLDNTRKGEILFYIERLRDELRIPIVYVSHSLDEVARLSDTVVVMSEGRAIACGPVQEVMARVDLHPYTGRFEGGAVLEAKVAAHDAEFDLTRLSFDGGELLCPGIDALPGETVRVRIRARDVSIALEKPVGISVLNVLRGVVSAISEAEGPVAEVKIKVGQDALIARVTKRSVHQLQLREGLAVHALIKAISLDRHSTGFA